MSVLFLKLVLQALCHVVRSHYIPLYAKKYDMYFVDIDKKPVTTTKPATTTTVNVDDIVDTGTCGIDGDNLTWTLDKNGTLTINGKGPMVNSQTPWRKNEEIMLKIKNIVIENGVTTIGSSAFADCEALTSITIPDSVTYIGEDAFSFCYALTSITIPDSVTHIGENAFYMSDLDSIIIENPECTIFWDEDTIPNLTKIYGYIGSRAQDYAVYFNRYFVELEKNLRQQQSQ